MIKVQCGRVSRVQFAIDATVISDQLIVDQCFDILDLVQILYGAGLLG